MKFRSLGRATLALGVLSGLATLLTSCGGGHTIGYAYVQSSPNSGTGTNYIYEVRSDNGALSQAFGIAAPSQNVAAIASVVTPDNKNLYVLYGTATNPQTGIPVSDATQGVIVHYGIRTENGDITALDTVQSPGADPVAMAIDPSGNYLYVVDSFGPGTGTGLSGPGDVTIFAIQPDAQGTSTVPGGTIIAPVCAMPGISTNQGAAVGSVGSGCYYSVGYGPRGVTQSLTAANATGYIYVTNSGNTAPASNTTCYGTVSGFTLAYNNPSGSTAAPGGQLTPVDFGTPLAGSCPNETPFPTGSLPVGVTPWAAVSVITGAGAQPFVYFSDFQQNQVYSYLAAINGTLSSTGTGNQQGAFTVGNKPESMLVDIRATHLFVTNFQDGTIDSLLINPGTGALSAVSGSPYGTGTGPLCIAEDPSEGKFLYVVNYLSGSVSGYQLNGQTGQLSALANQPFLIGSSSTGVNASQPTCVSIASYGSTPVLGTP